MNKLRVYWAISALAVAVPLAGCKTHTSTESRAPERDQTAVEEQLQKVISEGEAANADVEKWIAENEQKRIEEDSEEAKQLAQRIQQRFATAREGYEDFIRRYPKRGAGYAAYGDFLLGHYDEEGAQEQLERALELDKTNATVYNDLANIYGHCGSVKEAFNYYPKAIKFDPTETVYYQNFATTVFLFRKDAMEYYNINEQQVFDKAMALYSNAMRLDPTNFALAADVAKSYYGIKPWRFEDALRSWTNAMTLAHNDVETEEVRTHFARVLTQAGRYD